MGKPSLRNTNWLGPRFRDCILFLVCFFYTTSALWDIELLKQALVFKKERQAMREWLLRVIIASMLIASMLPYAIGVLFVY